MKLSGPTRLRIEGVPTSETVMEKVKRDHGRKVMVSFSCGKDSICAAFALKEAGFEIYPYYCYLVPGMSFVDRAIAYYEKRLDVRIVQLPHYQAGRMLDAMVYQPVDRLGIIEDANLPNLSEYDIQAAAADDHGVPRDTFTAVGVRAADSPQRRLAMSQHGPISEKKHKFYPVWDWTSVGVVDFMRQRDIRLPVDYWVFGRSFDGLGAMYTAPMKKMLPKDYAELLKVWPMVEADIRRYGDSIYRRKP